MKDTTDIDQLAALFELPSYDDIHENNLDYIWEAGDYAVREAQEEEDGELDESDVEEIREGAENAADREIFAQWYSGVTSAAERLFEEHALELVPKGRDKYSHEFKILPATKGVQGWRNAADAIRETINGVGYFHFNTLKEFLDSGPYSAKEAVLEHLHVIADYPKVYGSRSARSIYDSA
jgi:hypothetical protein